MRYGKKERNKMSKILWKKIGLNIEKTIKRYVKEKLNNN